MCIQSKNVEDVLGTMVTICNFSGDSSESEECAFHYPLISYSLSNFCCNARRSGNEYMTTKMAASMSEYENAMFLEVMDDDGLIVSAK